MDSIENLIGKTLTSVVNEDNEKITFNTTDGDEYIMYHRQDCCESVSIEDIAGDLEDLVGTPILKAEESSSATRDGYVKDEYGNDSTTWTYYLLATIKGYVTIRWFGSSNGCYSESVDFVKVKKRN